MNERCTPVVVPNVGPMLRVEHLTSAGELIRVEYRWPGPIAATLPSDLVPPAQPLPEPT